MSFTREVSRGMSFMRYLDTAGGDGDTLDEGPATEGAVVAKIIGRAEAAVIGEVGKEVPPLVKLEDSQFEFQRNLHGS